MGLQAELLEKRCRRSIAIVLSVKEREADRYLPSDVQAKLRKVIMDQFNELASLAEDMFESLAPRPTIVLNELFIEELRELMR